MNNNKIMKINFKKKCWCQRLPTVGSRVASGQSIAVSHGGSGWRCLGSCGRKKEKKREGKRERKGGGGGGGGGWWLTWCQRKREGKEKEEKGEEYTMNKYFDMSQIKINFQWHFKLALDFLPQENWQQKIGRKFNEPF